jgi:hypothetical protein
MTESNIAPMRNIFEGSGTSSVSFGLSISPMRAYVFHKLDLSYYTEYKRIATRTQFPAVDLLPQTGYQFELTFGHPLPPRHRSYNAANPEALLWYSHAIRDETKTTGRLACAY